MLQRIQTVFLALTGICMAIFLGTNSFIKAIGPTEKVVVNPFHYFYVKDGIALINTPTYYIAVVAVLSVLLTVFTIFQYKNRVRQMLFSALNSLFIGVALAITVYHIQTDAMKLGSQSVQGNYSIGMWAAFAALLFNWLANRFIRRDEKLVKNADRMR